MADLRLKRLLRPTPMKTGLTTLLISWLIYFSLGDHKPDFLADFDARIVDVMFQLRGPEQTTGNVVIVDIDEKSLKKYGQWPWPRDIVARLTQNIYDAAPLAVGFDILFAEPDQTSPTTVVTRYPELFSNNATSAKELINRAREVDHDRIFAQTLERGPTILGYSFLFSNDGLKQEGEHPRHPLSLTYEPQSADSRDISLLSAYRAIANIPQLAGSSRSEGFLNIFPDSSSVVRNGPLFLKLDNTLYPSLPFEMVRIGQHVDRVTIHLDTSSQQNALGVSDIQLGDRLIRTDSFGNIAINYRGPATTFMMLSAEDVLTGADTFLLQGKYVLVGSTAAGIMDVVATPFSQQTAGVEVHANIIDNLLADDHLVWENFTETGLTYAIIGVFGLLLIVCLTFLSPAAGFISGLGLLVTVAAGNYFLLFQKLKLIGLSYSLFSLLVIFLLVNFTHYFTEGRRRKFVRRAFSRYVSPSVVNKLLNSQNESGIQVESREVTVVFSDIRNFTRISETMSPTNLGDFLNHYLSRMTSLIIKHHGMVDKFIGDGIMAVWGTPLDDAQHPYNAVSGSLAMIADLQKQGSPEKIGDEPLAIGIGINSGPVSAGNFGSNNRFTYTVLGDTVNLASRIEGLTKFYGLPLLLSEATVAGLHAAIPCQKIDTVLVKGRNQPVQLFIAEVLFFNSDDHQLEKDLFNRVLRLYEDRDFTTAEQLVTDLIKRWPKKTYAIYQTRCRDFALCPPPKQWQGIWDFNYPQERPF